MAKGKYFYKGMLLIDYCRLHDLDYVVIYARIRRIEKKGILVTEEKLDEIISKVTRKMKTYIFRGVSLNTYCKEHNIPYKRVYRKIKKLETQNPEIIISEEIIEKIIMEVQNTTIFQIKYYWDNMPLKDYCELHEIPYESIQSRIKKDNSDTPISLKIGKAIELYMPNGIKYYVGNMPFVEFCEKENLDYKVGIKYLRANHEMADVIQILRKNRDKILQREIKEFLLTNLKHKDILLSFARENHFSFKNMDDILKEGIPLGNAIMLIYYLGTDNELQEKSVSINKVRDVVELLKKKEELNLEELLLLDGIGFIECRYYIKKKMKNIIRATLYKYIFSSEAIYMQAYQYLEDSIDYVLERNFINNPGSFTNYCKKAFYGRLMRFLKELAYKRDIDKEIIKDSFNLEENYIQKESYKIIHQAIQDLSEEEQKYIVIKYGFTDNKEKTDEEMLQFFPNFLLEDLIDFGKNTVQKLSEHEQIRKLI